jgi:hypothetical protein
MGRREPAVTGDQWDGHDTDPSPFAHYDLTDAIRKPPPAPGTLRKLVYWTKLTALSGEPESGKTVVGLWFLLAAMALQRHVVLVDQEVGWEQTATLLHAMGAPPALIGKYLHYFPFVDGNWMLEKNRRHLNKLLHEVSPVLTMFDSAADMMAASGMDENRNDQCRMFWRTVYAPLTREHRTAVLVIDHDSKGGAETRYSRGGGDKLAVANTTIKLAMVEPFTRLQDGLVRATVTKDRLGCLHRHWQITVTRDPLALAWEPTTAPARKSGSGNGKAWSDRPPGKQALLDALDQTPAGIKVLVDRIVSAGGFPMKRPTASSYLTELAAEGLAERIDQGRGFEALWCTPAPPGQPEPTNGGW